MHFITLHEVVARTRLSRTTIWRYVRAGRFPAPLRMSSGNSRYVLEDVIAWMANQEALPNTAGSVVSRVTPRRVHMPPAIPRPAREPR